MAASVLVGRMTKTSIGSMAPAQNAQVPKKVYDLYVVAAKSRLTARRGSLGGGGGGEG